MVSAIPQKTEFQSNNTNQFDLLPNEIIKNIASFLPPQNVLPPRLVSRRFAVLFGDRHVWCSYMKAQGLVPPESSRNEIGQFSLSLLAKTFRVWISLKGIIDSSVEDIIDSSVDSIDTCNSNVSRKAHLLTHCITTLAFSELMPLHSYVMKLLENHNLIPKDISPNDLCCRVVNGYDDFKHYRNLPTIALKKFQKHEEDPVIDSEFIDDLINKFTGGSSGLNKKVRKHLNNHIVVERLIHSLNTANNRNNCFVAELIKALGPIVNQSQVQRAICERLLIGFPDIAARWYVERVIWKVLPNAQLADEIKQEYRNKIPLIDKLANAEDVSKLTVRDNRKQLLDSLSNENNMYERLAAATVLAPFVSDDSEVLSAFLEQIKKHDFGDVGIFIVSVLAKLASRIDIRTILIKDGPLTGYISSSKMLENPNLRLITIQVLRPFIDEPEVREAFLKRLKEDDFLLVKCELLEALAPQIEKEDVLPLFLQAANGKLFHQPHSSTELQVVAIDKLGSLIGKPEVNELLIKLFNNDSCKIKAACIRPLSSGLKTPLINVETIFRLCSDKSKDVQKAAHDALMLWINPTASMLPSTISYRPRPGLKPSIETEETEDRDRGRA